MMIGISACLSGIACRYDGRAQSNQKLMEMVQKEQAVVVCPEVLGGLPTPRKPAEIIGGDGYDVWNNQAQVFEKDGQDVTEIYKAGAKIALQKLQELNVKTLILKEKSPSCGSLSIYDGSFSGNKIAGVGVATAYFLNNGLEVISDTEWEEKLSPLSL